MQQNSRKEQWKDRRSSGGDDFFDTSFESSDDVRLRIAKDAEDREKQQQKQRFEDLRKAEHSLEARGNNMLQDEQKCRGVLTNGATVHKLQQQVQTK